MKLVRIFHSRCSEYDGYTYCLAPDEWTEDEIWDRVDEAQTKYLKEYQTVYTEKPPYSYSPDYAKYPHLTVAEVQSLWETQKAAYDEWKKKTENQEQGFEHYLHDEGFKPLWGEDMALEIELDWGHRHGMSLKYGEELKGIPSPKVLREKDEGKEVDDEYE